METQYLKEPTNGPYRIASTFSTNMPATLAVALFTGQLELRAHSPLVPEECPGIAGISDNAICVLSFDGKEQSEINTSAFIFFSLTSWKEALILMHLT